MPYTPQIQNTSANPLTSKAQWMLVQDTLYAQGGELYMTIGNFMADSLSDTVFVGGGINQANFAYYYIDDVSVTDIGWVGEKELVDVGMRFSVYPNPNNGMMQLEYELPENTSGLFTLMDVTGKVLKIVTLASENNLMEINCSEFSGGIYFYKITVGGNDVKQDKIVIIK
jgi:hypothetical protein